MYVCRWWWWQGSYKVHKGYIMYIELREGNKTNGYKEERDKQIEKRQWEKNRWREINLYNGRWWLWWWGSSGLAGWTGSWLQQLVRTETSNPQTYNLVHYQLLSEPQIVMFWIYCMKNDVYICCHWTNPIYCMFLSFSFFQCKVLSVTVFTLTFFQIRQYLKMTNESRSIGCL